jgi:tryptophan-rich sensory protein
MSATNDAGWNRVLGFLAWLVTVVLAAGLATLASVDAERFYGQLAKPDWAPGSGIFAPVWTVLYLLMAVAAWLVWRARGFAGAPVALGLFLVQLALNALWSWLFFAWREGAAALADIVILTVLVAIVAVAFWRVRPLAGALLVPYLAWLVYAAVLNYRVWQLNPGGLASVLSH